MVKKRNLSKDWVKTPKLIKSYVIIICVLILGVLLITAWLSFPKFGSLFSDKAIAGKASPNPVDAAEGSQGIGAIPPIDKFDNEYMLNSPWVKFGGGASIGPGGLGFDFNGDGHNDFTIMPMMDSLKPKGAILTIYYDEWFDS
jgi:hypothetical protein